jgi:hypothetical protein
LGTFIIGVLRTSTATCVELNITSKARMSAASASSLHGVANPVSVVPQRHRWARIVFAILVSTHLAYGIQLVIVEPQSFATVIIPRLNLLGLLYLISRFDQSPPGSVGRRSARIGIWILTTSITVHLTYIVAGVLPWEMAVLVCALSAATIVFGFLLLLINPNL